MGRASSISSEKHPYCRNRFRGTKEIRAIFASLMPEKPGAPLMNDKEWEKFLQQRRNGNAL